MPVAQRVAAGPASVARRAAREREPAEAAFDAVAERDEFGLERRGPRVVAGVAGAASRFGAAPRSRARVARSGSRATGAPSRRRRRCGRCTRREGWRPRHGPTGPAAPRAARRTSSSSTTGTNSSWVSNDVERRSAGARSAGCAAAQASTISAMRSSSASVSGASLGPERLHRGVGRGELDGGGHQAIEHLALPALERVDEVAGGTEQHVGTARELAERRGVGDDRRVGGLGPVLDQHPLDLALVVELELDLHETVGGDHVAALRCVDVERLELQRSVARDRRRTLRGGGDRAARRARRCRRTARGLRRRPSGSRGRPPGVAASWSAGVAVSVGAGGSASRSASTSSASAQAHPMSPYVTFESATTPILRSGSHRMCEPYPGTPPLCVTIVPSR